MFPETETRRGLKNKKIIITGLQTAERHRAVRVYLYTRIHLINPTTYLRTRPRVQRNKLHFTASPLKNRNTRLAADRNLLT